MARFTVTVDLPTPPLPDDTPMTRVVASGPRNAGIGARRDRARGRGRRHRARRRRRCWSASPSMPGPQAMAERGPLLLGHHHEIELDLLDARPRRGPPGGSPRPARRCRARRPPAGPPRSSTRRRRGCTARTRPRSPSVRPSSGSRTALNAASSCDWSAAMHSLVSDGIRRATRARGRSSASPQLKGLIPR